MLRLNVFAQAREALEDGGVVGLGGFEDAADLAFADAEFGGKHALANGAVAQLGVAVAGPTLDEGAVARGEADVDAFHGVVGGTGEGQKVVKLGENCAFERIVFCGHFECLLLQHYKLKNKLHNAFIFQSKV